MNTYSYIRVLSLTINPLHMNTLTASDYLSRKRQIILDEIATQKEMLSYWGGVAQTAKNINLEILKLETALQDLKD